MHRKPDRAANALTLIFFTLLGVGISNAGHAWGPLGHKLAGEIGETYLDANTHRRIEEIIGKESLADASTWADRMRSDPSAFWQREAGAYHYVTVPRGRRYDEVGPPRKGDALTALNDFREELLDPKTSRERRALVLRFAIHIVQDLHQPLHVGRKGDRGGNDVELKVQGKRSNLHRLWDSQILYSAGRSDRQWLSFFRSSGLLREPRTADADPMAWIEESAEMRETLYPAPKNVGKDYLQRELPRAEIRLALAGIRTAAWLNATLGGPGESGNRNLSGDEASQRDGDSRESWWENLFKSKSP